jgi:hypothetical protein
VSSPNVRTFADPVGRRRRLHVSLAALACAAVVGLCATPSYATWRNVRGVSRGTAEVLEKGELTFGVFAPIAYGVTDSLTVQSSPIFDLLLIPNITARYRFLHTNRLVLAATANYKQAFLGTTQPGELDAGVLGTLYIDNSVALTGGLLVAQRFSLSEAVGFEGGVALYGAAHVLLNPKNLLMVTGYLRTTASGGMQRPLLTVAWVRQLRIIFNMHLVVGLSYGTFPLRINSDPPVEPEKIVPTNVPVWPVLDAWWRY